MLRKRTRSLQKDQQMGHLTIYDTGFESHFQSDILGQGHKSSSLFSASSLFVGLSPKGLSDSDSIRSPTSPLDFRVFSNLRRLPKLSIDRHQKSWDCSKVGLSIIDSLDDNTKVSGKVLRSSESKSILFGPGMRIKTPNYRTQSNSFQSPKSLPNNYAIFPHTQIKSRLHKSNSDVIFEIGETPSGSKKILSGSLDSCISFPAVSGLTPRNSNLSSGNFCLGNITQVGSPPQLIEGSPNSNKVLCTKLNSMPISVGSGNGFIGSLSASEIELSEDYTCVISHGPNPKKTHIFGDCILECHDNDLSNFGKKEEHEIGSPQVVHFSEISNPYSSNDFLSVCYSCNKKLEEGKDIYIYRGENAFCSLNCRSQEILIAEEMEKNEDKFSENSPKADIGKELFETGIFPRTLP